MKKICFILAIFMCSIFLSGCTYNNSKKDNIIVSPENKVIASQKKDGINIPIVDNFDLIIESFKLCKPSQFFEDNNPNIKTIVIFGYNNNICPIMFNKDNFKNNIKCYFDKSLLDNVNIIKQLYYSVDYGAKDFIDKNCKEIDLEKYKNVNIPESLPKNIFTDEEAKKNIKNAVKLENQN